MPYFNCLSSTLLCVQCTCSCLDATIHSTVCKHIHLIYISEVPKHLDKNHQRYLNSSITKQILKLWSTLLIQPYYSFLSPNTTHNENCISSRNDILWCYSHLVWLVSEGLIHALVFIQKTFLWFYWIAPVINVSLSFVPNVVPWSFAEVLSPQKTHKYN